MATRPGVFKVAPKVAVTRGSPPFDMHAESPSLDRISANEARRIAVAAQGLGAVRPRGRCDRRHLARVLARTQLLQIDSVSVVARAHYLPLFSRLGPYPVELLDRAAWGTKRERSLFEFWGHEASLLPFELQPLLRWRMARAARGEDMYGGLARFGLENRKFVRHVLDQVRERGARTAGELDHPSKRTGGWWGWDDNKRALEFLFWAGELTTATRRGFERVYDLPERVLPAAILAQPTPSEADAQRALVRRAADALGIATERDLRDYFRLTPQDSKRAVAALVEAGALLPVTVEGWRDQAYLAPQATRPRRVNGAALLAPFDPLVWERARAERLFGFRYRIEIYVPAHKRTHGYYVLPFLLRDRLVARVDVKSDRLHGTLRVHGAWHQDDADPRVVAPALYAELRALADWLSLEKIAIGGKGDLAPHLKRLAK
jgi:uncharacterized protein